MTAKVWDIAKRITLNIEGGYQCDPNDKGNWTGGNIGIGKLKGTKYGISAASYPNVDIKNLTKEQAEILYKRDFWGKNRCDYMPDALSIAVFDYSIHSGSRAIRDLQSVLGVKVDGKVGNQTLGACNSQPLKIILDKYLNKRLSYIIMLCEKKKYAKYKNGWINRLLKIREVCKKYGG